MPPRFSFLPPQFISCPPHGIFFGGRSCFFWPETTLKFVISVRKSLQISAKTFFFGDHLILVGIFAISGRKSLRISAKTFFFWRSPAFGRKKTLKFRPEKAFGNRRKPLPPWSREAGDATACCVIITLHILIMRSWILGNYRPGATGGHSGTASPPNHCLCLLNKNCAPQTRIVPPKKVIGPVSLECNSRLETSKILVITPGFVSKNCFFANFAIKIFNFFFGLHPEIREKSRIFCNKDLFLFFILFYFGLRPWIRGSSRILRDKDLCFLVYTLEFDGKKFLCPPKNCLRSSPQSRYYGAGTGKFPKECDYKHKLPKWDFYKESKEIQYLTRCVALRFESLWTSNRCFSELKYLSLVGLALSAECLRKDSINKPYLSKQTGKDQLDDLELDGPLTLRNWDGIAWDFTWAKWWMHIT